MTREELDDLIKQEFSKNEKVKAQLEAIADQMEADEKTIQTLRKVVSKCYMDLYAALNDKELKTLSAMEAVKKKIISAWANEEFQARDRICNMASVNCADILRDIERKSSGVNDE